QKVSGEHLICHRPSYNIVGPGVTFSNPTLKEYETSRYFSIQFHIKPDLKMIPTTLRHGSVHQIIVRQTLVVAYTRGHSEISRWRHSFQHRSR
uniref:Uncharacterized protein n=1 Tax=Ciona intestinalis TaxID=7719 RepID=H2Y0Z8_CIOIN